MASRLLRRSGFAVEVTAERLGWKPDFVIQVGIGIHHKEVHVLSEQWPNTKFLGFEPHPDLRDSMKDYPGVVRQIAISDTQGSAVLYSKSRHKDGSSILPFNDGNKVRKEIVVQTDTLDNQISKSGWYESLLWLDCEGSELRALQGADELLKSVKMVNVEMTPDPPSIHWPTPNEIHLFLQEHEFYRQYIHTMKGGQYDAIYVKGDIFQAKYCCCPYTVEEFEEKNNA